jgi:hypothetical protein
MWLLTGLIVIFILVIGFIIYASMPSSTAPTSCGGCPTGCPRCSCNRCKMPRRKCGCPPPAGGCPFC